MTVTELRHAMTGTLRRLGRLDQLVPGAGRTTSTVLAPATTLTTQE